MRDAGRPEPIVELRGDQNRTGIIDLDAFEPEKYEATWDQSHGAIFLANIDDDEIVRLPVLYRTAYGKIVGLSPDLVNGISLGDTRFVAPRPHGPVIGGKDIFMSRMEAEFAKLGIDISWVEDWELYHAHDGEVHCGSNTTRQVPANSRWWESGL